MTTPRSRLGIRSIREVVVELRRMRDVSCPYSTTFVEAIPWAARGNAEVELREAFLRWYDTYILPLAADLEKKIKP